MWSNVVDVDAGNVVNWCNKHKNYTFNYPDSTTLPDHDMTLTYVEKISV